MVSADMFKDAFVLPKKVAQPQMIPNPNYVAPAPRRPAPGTAYEDPNIAKLKFMVLKWLTIIIAGGAALLIAWRIVLKFF